MSPRMNPDSMQRPSTEDPATVTISLRASDTDRIRVYLHGLGLDANMWHLETSVENRLLNFPGFGGTCPLSAVSIPHLADHVAEQLEGPAHVIGFSMGSYVAQELVLRHPSLVGSLVLACGESRDTRDRSRSRAEALRKATADGTTARLLSEWSRDDYPAGEPAQYSLATSIAAGCGVLAAYWDALSGHDTSDRLHQVDVPTTVVAAAGDRAVPVSAMRAMADAISNSRLRIVPGTHLMPLETPQVFATLVNDHLDWVRTGAMMQSRSGDLGVPVGPGGGGQ